MDYEILFVKDPEFDDAYFWQSPEGREFEVRVLDDGDLMLNELIPNGLLCYEKPGEGVPFIDHSSELVQKLRRWLNEFDMGPSEFFSNLPDSVSLNNLIRGGGGQGIGTIYQSTFDEVRALIREAIECDFWYSSWNREKAKRIERQQETSGQRAQDKLDYWQSKLSMLTQAHPDESDRFTGISNAFGTFGPTQKDPILGFLNSPSKHSWDELAHVILVGGHTAWQIVCEFDSDAPRSLPHGDDPERWPGYPDPEKFMGWVEQFRQQQIDQARAKVSEAKRELAEVSEPLRSVQ